MAASIRTYSFTKSAVTGRERDFREGPRLDIPSGRNLVDDALATKIGELCGVQTKNNVCYIVTRSGILAATGKDFLTVEGGDTRWYHAATAGQDLHELLGWPAELLVESQPDVYTAIGVAVERMES